MNRTLIEAMAAYTAVKTFLQTESAVHLCSQIEKETGKPAYTEQGLDVWCHPRLAKMLALWLDNPDMIEWANKELHDPGTPPFIV